MKRERLLPQIHPIGEYKFRKIIIFLKLKKIVLSLKPLWSDLEEAPIPNINEFSQLFSRQVVEPKVAKKKVQQKKKTEVSF